MRINLTNEGIHGIKEIVSHGTCSKAKILTSGSGFSGFE
jgi:hypothetical protein